MGQRFYLGIGLLLILLFLGLFTAFGMEALHMPEAKLLKQAEELALSGDFTEAAHLASQAQARWDRYRHLTAAVADHTPMDEVERLFAEMEIYAKTQEKAHFAACCNQLQIMCQAMADAHSPAWWNLL